MVKKNACVFISGSGTNLKALIKSSRNYNFPINIKYIVSNTKKANGLRFARLYKSPYLLINLKNNLKTEQLFKELKKHNISIICLAGYMKVLKKKFIQRFKNKIKKYFSKEFKPYEIGYISKERKKINIYNSLKW